MENEFLSLVMGFIAMSFVVVSYFVKNKKFYLFYQACCIVFLILSYLFNAQYFAMLALGTALLRTLTCYWYEKENKVAPIGMAFLFSGMALLAYVLVNVIMSDNAQPLDILCLIATAMYAFVFRVRNLKAVRYLMLIPTVISILFNVLTDAAIFVTISYVFELCADVVSIFKYYIFGKEPKKEEKKEA